MEKKFLSPFGYRYNGNHVSIKLRFTKEKFVSAKIEEYGKHFTTKNGHIIFEAEYLTDSPSLAELSGLLKQLKPTK
jgi:hypothetical protein